jgi:hypothetical protein
VKFDVVMKEPPAQPVMAKPTMHQSLAA